MPTLGNAIFQAAGFRPGASGIMFQSDNAADIGATAANRPRDVHLGRNLAAGGQITAGTHVIAGGTVQAAAGSPVEWNGRSRVVSPSDGIVRLENNAATDFSRLQFGGATTSFPALKRNSTSLRAVLADDSADTNFYAAFLGGHQNTGAGSPAFEAWNKATAGDNLLETFYTEGGGGTLRGSIDFNRGATQVRYNTTSDGALKNILGDAPRAKSLGILRATRLREFAWKDDPSQKPQIGPIAQELYEVFRGAVSVGGPSERPEDYEVEEFVDEMIEEVVERDGLQVRTGSLVPSGKRVPTKVTRTRMVPWYRPWAVDKTAFTFHLVAGFQYHDELLVRILERLGMAE